MGNVTNGASTPISDPLNSAFLSATSAPLVPTWLPNRSAKRGLSLPPAGWLAGCLALTSQAGRGGACGAVAGGLATGEEEEAPVEGVGPLGQRRVELQEEGAGLAADAATQLGRAGQATLAQPRRPAAHLGGEVLPAQPPSIRRLFGEAQLDRPRTHGPQAPLAGKSLPPRAGRLLRDALGGGAAQPLAARQCLAFPAADGRLCRGQLGAPLRVEAAHGCVKWRPPRKRAAVQRQKRGKEEVGSNLTCLAGTGKSKSWAGLFISFKIFFLKHKILEPS